MKEFNNYIKKEYPHINSGDKEFGFDIWKAALGWVLTTGYINDYGENEISSWDIEEELEGT